MTAKVLIGNVELVEPAGIVTLGAVDAMSGLELVSFTTSPEAGAGPLSMTVPKTED